MSGLLAWGMPEDIANIQNTHGPFDLILAADCMFDAAVCGPFCCILVQLLPFGTTGPT